MDEFEKAVENLRQDYNERREYDKAYAVAQVAKIYTSPSIRASIERQARLDEARSIHALGYLTSDINDLLDKVEERIAALSQSEPKCSKCGEAQRQAIPLILDENPLSIAEYLEERCEQCGQIPFEKLPDHAKEAVLKMKKQEAEAKR